MCDYFGEEVLAGIASFGPQYCGINGIPGAFTNIVTHRRWIIEKAYLDE